MKSVVVVAVLLSSRVYAQPASGDPQVAREYTAAALVASKNDDFETAIAMYQKAYAVAPHPVLLWDIAQVHRRAAEKLRDTDPARAAGHRDLAREFFRRFLETRPDEDMAGKARMWLTKLDQQWADQYPGEQAARRADEDRRREAATRVERARQAAEHERIAERDRIEQEHIDSAIGQTASAARRGQARTVKIAGAAGIAAGLVGVGAGVYFGFKARRIANQLSASDVYDPKRIADGNAAERSMAIAYVAGGTLLVAGALTYWIGHRLDTRIERASLTIAPAHGGAIVGIVGGF